MPSCDYMAHLTQPTPLLVTIIALLLTPDKSACTKLWIKSNPVPRMNVIAPGTIEKKKKNKYLKKSLDGELKTSHTFTCDNKTVACMELWIKSNQVPR